MIERLIFTALQAGIVELTLNPRLLERYFEEQHGLQEEEIASIRAYFLDSPPHIEHQYPRGDSQFPLYAIILSGERESTVFLGGDGEDVPYLGEDDEDAGAEQKASIWDHDYTVLCIARHPDVVRYYYEIAKYILIRSREYFIENGVLDMKFSGADLVPDPRYIPAHLFVRQLMMNAQREHIQIGHKLGRATRIAGVHVEDGAATGVKTLVTPYDTEESGEL